MRACFDSYVSQHLIWSLAEPCINLRKFVPSSLPPLNSIACASWIDFDQTFECPVKITLSDEQQRSGVGLFCQDHHDNEHLARFTKAKV